MILHEIVHVLQRIATRVPPEQFIWLYEAVACYLAEQSAEISQSGNPVSWDTVKQNFYTVPGCYGIAYHLGKALLSGCPPGDVIARCSDVPRCETICAETYAGLFK